MLALEVIGSLMLWAPVPFAWIWLGGRVYRLTGSLVADGGVTLVGFAVTVAFALRGLNRLDAVWVALRRRAGHDRRDGALTQVVVVSATLGLIAFLIWYYVLTHAFLLPFMPSR